MLPKVKKYLTDNFEGLFVLIVLTSIALINYYIPYKIAFLNFYYIPVLLSAFYLGRKKTLYGGILCVFLVTLFAYLAPDSFLPGTSRFDIFFNISTWACFLILTGIMLGTIQEKLHNQYQKTLTLNKELDEKEQKLLKANEDLDEYSRNLEKKVKERTETLEKSKETVEVLKRKVEEALYSTMDPAVVKLIIEERLQNEKRKISILFSDLEGFSRYSEELGPEVVINDLNRYIEEMETAILQYRGHIDKYIGDGIMAEFGAPVEYETHSLQAVLAGLKMQEKMEKFNYPWKMRIGISTGEAITGLIGRKRQTYTAIGDVVNLASRVQEDCTPGLVTIDESTFQEVRPFFNVKRKLNTKVDDKLDENKVRELEELHQAHDHDPQDLEAIRSLAYMYKSINALPVAMEFFKQALDLAPDDNKVKLAFAETSHEIRKHGDIPIRGKKKLYHLYEITGLKDPLEDRSRIPQELFDHYFNRVEKCVEYPEGIIHPIEALDGSIGHSKCVGFLSYAIADSMGITDKEKEEILQAAYLCDLGKEIIPHHYLNRSDTLDIRECKEIGIHPTESVHILKKYGYETDQIFKIIECHHERPNGTGYPRGLGEADIPLGSRIIAIADMYITLTSWRPYREGWEHRAAISEIQRETRQGRFDTQAAEQLERLIGISA